MQKNNSVLIPTASIVKSHPPMRSKIPTHAQPITGTATREQAGPPLQ